MGGKGQEAPPNCRNKREQLRREIWKYTYTKN
jgi:hypothetical protein